MIAHTAGVGNGDKLSRDELHLLCSNILVAWIKHKPVRRQNVVSSAAARVTARPAPTITGADVGKLVF